jgi:hypothetical protein
MMSYFVQLGKRQLSPSSTLQRRAEEIAAEYWQRSRLLWKDSTISARKDEPSCHPTKNAQ